MPSLLVVASLLAALSVALAVLVALAERRYRAIRLEIVEREDEDAALTAPERASPIAELVGRLAEEARAEARSSGHRLLPDGPQALGVRLALIAAAARTLDLQYYTWADDLAGRVLARAALDAADRGVRVRVIVDDLHARGARDLIETLAAHPLITVRVFNPALTRRAWLAHWIVDFRRMNRRMHNKALVADGAAAITGGRNVADSYYGLSSIMNFRDLDVLAVGPAAGALEASVDRYWNGEFAFPAAAFGIEERADPNVVAERRTGLDRRIAEAVSATAEQARAGAQTTPTLATALSGFVWCPSHLLDDPPDAPRVGADRVARHLARDLDAAHERIEIEAAYFVPGREGVGRFASLTERGVAIAALTNSFATNDVLAAQAGYAKYRPTLLRAGLELYEFKPDAPVRTLGSLLGGSLTGSRPGRGKVAGLHTKALLIDGRRSYVGSFNLDPRSARDNSEVMLAVEGEAFAERLGAVLAEGRSPDVSYKVTLATDGGTRNVLEGSTHRSRERWHEGSRIRTDEPSLTRPAALLAAFVQRLPIERLL